MRGVRFHTRQTVTNQIKLIPQTTMDAVSGAPAQNDKNDSDYNKAISSLIRKT